MSSAPWSTPAAVTGISVTAGESCDVTTMALATDAPATESGSDARLAELTTLRVGGPARRIVTASTEEQLVQTVTAADESGEPVLVLGGGSNVLVADAGFPGTVVRVATRGITADVSACSGATVTVAAGEDWDRFVATAVEQEWIGTETLSGIPGLVGGTPIQNVGAYGSEVAQTIATVRTWDRLANRQRTFAMSDCGFAYRHSLFKAEPDRYLVLAVTFQFTLGSLSAPIRYAELARALDVPVGSRAPAADVRAAVLALRAGKGMVLDPSDHDTWSAGSFFTNPVLDSAQVAALPADAPRYPLPDGRLKTSAAWLIEHAGFQKGYGTQRASLSTKHTLALTNRGGATAADLLDLAREVRAGVQQRYGITLIQEPVLVECTL
jgi:UDP-N-acetylmuramate dehydrogenase